MKDITQVVKEIIESLTFEFNAKTVTAVGDDFLLTTCNTYWLRPPRILTISGNDYQIKSLVINQSITLTPLGHSVPPPTGNIFTIPAPVYKHGTARAINTELSIIPQPDKVPLVWLYELFKEKYNYDEESTIGLTSPVRIFIFDEANPTDMQTEDHYTDVVRPLKSIAHEMVKYINSNQSKYQEVESIDITGLPNWGEFNGNTGNTQRILDEQWSGLELNFELSANKENICCS